MPEYYFLRIKKDYAAAVIEDLQKMKAIEVVQPEDVAIPEWQKREVRSRLDELKMHPDKAVSWASARKKLMQLTK